MANATVTRIGQVNAAGDALALFLKTFGGEVITAFEEVNVFKDNHVVRNITSGKSASFPATWKVNAAYHTPGAEIVGQTTNQNERIITIDDLLIADVFIANIDEAMNHYDFRSEYSKQTGYALSNQWDKNCAQTGVLAARATATVTGGSGGSALTNAAYNSDSSVLASGLWDAAQALDEKDIPEMERSAYFRPAEFYLLAQNTTLLNQDWGGKGSYAEGKVPMVANIAIRKTNHLPSTNIVTGDADYQGDFSTTVGLVMHRSAIGTVKLMDLAMESDYDIRRQGTLIVSKYAVGHGILRPESAVELKTA